MHLGLRGCNSPERRQERDLPHWSRATQRECRSTETHQEQPLESAPRASVALIDMAAAPPQDQQQPGSAVDALSYIDKDYDDPRMKQMVHSLIEEEMAAFEPPDYLADKPAPSTRFASPLLKSEWARVRAGKPMDPMDTSRYDLQPPQGAAAEDEAAWKRALDNARAQTEHQHNRFVRQFVVLLRVCLFVCVNVCDREFIRVLERSVSGVLHLKSDL